jgi:aspartate/methionine/tyrosine aminotransferase
MTIAPFKLERYFAQHEFSAPLLMCCSDGEPMPLGELLAWSDMESLALWNRLTLGYTESAGHPLLRQEIAALYPETTAEDVLVCAPEEGIFIAMHTLLKPGDHVVVTYPGYQSLYQIAESLDCQVSHWAPRWEEDTWRFDLADLWPLLRDDTRLIVINFPHNPTGALISADELAQIMAAAHERGAVVFSDEMYRLLEFDPATRLPSAVSLEESAVALSGLSKAFMLAGLRIGWLITRDAALRARLAAFKDYTTICPPAPSELLALMALRTKDRLLERLMHYLRRNLDLLDATMPAFADRIAWRRPPAGTVAFPRLLDAIPVAEFCDALRAQQGVLLLPGDVYDWSGNHFRLGFGRKSLPQALEGLVAYLRG